MTLLSDDNPPRRYLTRIGVFLGFVLAAFAAMLGYLYLGEPEPKAPAIEVFDRYDRTGMRLAMSPERVGAYQARILDCGSRFIGSEGFIKVQDLIRRAWDDAGLEVIEQRCNTVAPHTIRREITGADGAALEGVEVYPFLPNQFQPVSTDDEGATGTLVRVTDEVLLTRTRFDDCIALVDMSEPPTGLGADWRAYAQLGFQAVIVAHPEGLGQIRWTRAHIEWMVSNVPVNYPRLAANKAVFAYAGRQVRVLVQSRFVNAPNINFIGLLRSGSAAPANEAVVVTTQYDAASWLPDLAPGSMQAMGLAAQLALLEGLAEHRPHLRRDVIFIATGARSMGQAGICRLLSVLGANEDKPEARRYHAGEQVRHARLAERFDRVLDCFEDPGFAVDEQVTSDALDALDARTQEAVLDQVPYVLNTLLLELKEPLLEAKLAFLRTGEDVSSDEYDEFLAAQKKYESVLMVVGYRIGKVLREHGDLVRRYDVRRRFRERFAELAAYHREQSSRAATGVRINDMFSRYRQSIIYTPLLAPSLESGSSGGQEAVSFYLGRPQTTRLDYHTTLGPPINDLLASVAQRSQTPQLRFVSLSSRHAKQMEPKLAGSVFDSTFWVAAGYPAFGLIHTNRVGSYQQLCSPVDSPAMRNTESMAGSLRLLGDATLSLAYGNGRFESSKMLSPRHFGGRVLVGGLGRSIVPNYPLRDAVVSTKTWHVFNSYGRFEQLLFWTDPYGRYDFPLCFAIKQIMPANQEVVTGMPSYSPVAVGYDNRGRIRFIRDEGPVGQKAYRSMALHWDRDVDKANIVVFRAAPVTVLDRVNPQTLKDYAAIELLDRDRLSPVGKYAFFTDDAVTRFIEPDQRFYVALKAGSADNELVRTTRAFMLGITEDWRPDPGSTREIDGPGYLGADSALLLDVPVQVARSMAFVNQRRLDLQNRHGMADERTNLFHERAAALLDEAEDPSRPQYERALRARDAVTYQTLNHPVLRGSITEAVVSILWYLCLLVPFAFFFEKLLFGFPDIRKQLAAQGVIFVISFALLKLLHPAFEMIRSSLMILLGFIIMLISGGITILFSGKFQENLEGLRAKRGVVAAAEVNKLGVVGTAFMLGLNNMHRRKVRTGLTCSTLALITFAMICFTTTRSDVVNTEMAVGEAGYQGFLIKSEKIQHILDGEVDAVRTRFGHRFEVAVRCMVVGRVSAEREMLTPQLTVEFNRQGVWRSAPAKSVLTFDPNEPLASQVTFLTKRGWFEPQSEAQLAAMDATPIMLPAPMAEQLGVTPAAVDASEVRIRLNGRAFVVHSIFEPQSLRRIRDLDGRQILPFDAESMQDPQADGIRRVFAVEPYSYIDPAGVVIARTISGLPLGEEILVRRASIAVWLRDRRTGEEAPYKEARRQIDQYLEQSGRMTYYGLARIAYEGKRARERTIAGLLDMLIPLIIAALTVLNTIRGSVYERRDEIYVYNAVGIAPRYVFFMFFAEAFVYAVVGTVLGYFLSQGAGRILTELGWTGGLNMTFTSLTTVLASVAIMTAVFASTLFPAFSAMRIAAPAEESGWDLPEPDGDHLRMMLPFTFDHEDRLAILEFFNRFFLDHGEGSSGAFFCDVPRLGLHDDLDPLTDGDYIPELTVTVWLKPYDLGVSQKLSIAMPTDPETHEFVARLTLTRLSGTQKAWMRLNQRFLVRVRKHFLHWRAVGDVERAEMFDQARELMTRQLTAEGALHAS